MDIMPVLETERLLIRPFIMEDLQDAHRLFDIELNNASLYTERYDSLADRAEWLQWAVLNDRQLAKLNQPPYGDRAVILRSSGKLIGACGYVPCLNAFGQMPNLSAHTRQGVTSTEFGLFYAIAPAHQRRGYAVEAAHAMIDYAFQVLHLRRIVAETGYENHASIGVMKKLGMQVAHNPYPDPSWLEVVGVIENPNQ